MGIIFNAEARRYWGNAERNMPYCFRFLNRRLERDDSVSAFTRSGEIWRMRSSASRLRVEDTTSLVDDCGRKRTVWVGLKILRDKWGGNYAAVNGDRGRAYPASTSSEILLLYLLLLYLLLYDSGAVAALHSGLLGDR